MLKCPRRARLDEVIRSKPGFAAWVGILVHRALEALAGELVTADTLLAAVDEHAGRNSPAVVTRAREIAASVGVMDLRDSIAAEKRFNDLAVGDYQATGVIDRIDQTASESGGKRLLVVDYKTGRVQSRSELEGSPQTILYLAWAAEKYFGGRVGDLDTLAMIYEYPEPGIRIRIDYDEEAVRLGISSAAMIWRRYLEDSDRPATPDASWCSHCGHRGDCPAVDKLITKTKSRPEWEDMALSELVELRHQLKQDAGMLDAVCKEVDQEIMSHLEGAGLKRWEGDDYRATMTSRKSKAYSAQVLTELGKLTGMSIERLVQRCCTVNGPKLQKTLGVIGDPKELERARRVVSHYESVAIGRPYLIVRSKGGLF